MGSRPFFRPWNKLVRILFVSLFVVLGKSGISALKHDFVVSNNRVFFLAMEETTQGAEPIKSAEFADYTIPEDQYSRGR